MKLSNKQQLNVAPPLSLREYLATLAPDEVADWYRPEPKTPRPVCPPIEGFGVPAEWADRRAYWATDHFNYGELAYSLPKGDMPESAKRYRAAYGEWSTALEEWKRTEKAARATSWPWAWADLVLAARGEPGK